MQLTPAYDGGILGRQPSGYGSIPYGVTNIGL